MPLQFTLPEPVIPPDPLMARRVFIVIPHRCRFKKYLRDDTRGYPVSWCPFHKKELTDDSPECSECGDK